MIFYLDNGDKFNLFISPIEVVFVFHCSISHGPVQSKVRWLHKSSFDIEHLEKVVSYLKSPDLRSRRIGKAFLEAMLKVKIHGDVNER